MTTSQSLLFGFKSSTGYFISTFLFGLMFGITAGSVGLQDWQALLMSATVFSASAQFVSLEFWLQPLPFGTIALSVALVSTRNILLGMAMADHFDGHSLLRRVSWLFLLNDPGVVTALHLKEDVDRLGYVFGYGLALMISWLVSTIIGFEISGLFSSADLNSLDFAGALVIATMMILFIKGSKSQPLPWITSGVAALILFEINAPDYLILLISVIVGIIAAIFKGKSTHE